jgi:hypothetical protein
MQFDGPTTARKIARLMSQRLKLLASLPNNAGVVRVDNPARLTAPGCRLSRPVSPGVSAPPRVRPRAR